MTYNSVFWCLKILSQYRPIFLVLIMSNAVFWGGKKCWIFSFSRVCQAAPLLLPWSQTLPNHFSMSFILEGAGRIPFGKFRGSLVLSNLPAPSGEDERINVYEKYSSFIAQIIKMRRFKALWSKDLEYRGTFSQSRKKVNYYYNYNYRRGRL